MTSIPDRCCLTCHFLTTNAQDKVTLSIEERDILKQDVDIRFKIEPIKVVTLLCYNLYWTENEEIDKITNQLINTYKVENRIWYSDWREQVLKNIDCLRSKKMKEILYKERDNIECEYLNFSPTMTLIAGESVYVRKTQHDESKYDRELATNLLKNSISLTKATWVLAILAALSLIFTSLPRCIDSAQTIYSSVKNENFTITKPEK